MNEDPQGKDSEVASSEQSAPAPKRESRREFLEAVLFAIMLALFIRTFVVQAFKIPSGSMIPTLLVGDHILVNKFVYGIPIPLTDSKLVQFKTPKRGEVIVFKYPADPSKDFIKRVVGVPGDLVAMRAGVLHVNDRPVPLLTRGEYDYREVSEGPILENLLYDEVLGDSMHKVIFSRDVIPGTRNLEPIKVPEGKLFVMGDNRDRSNDSRFWGFVDIEAVEGRAIGIYWSWDSENTSLRWRRLGSGVY